MPSYPRVSLVLALCATSCLAVACNSSSEPANATAGGGRGGGRGSGASAPVPAVLGRVTQEDVPVDITSIGNVEAFSTISVRSQVTGAVVDVKVAEGAFIKAGDVLFTIDRRPYEAAVAQAVANLAKDQALLTQSTAQVKRDVANADYTRGEADRQTQLAARGLVSKDVLDQAVSAADANAAAVNADQAAIESAKAEIVAQQAAVDSAKVQLDYTIITSPIAGRTGSLEVRTGNLVTANTTEMMTITQIEPVFVTFSMPSTHLPDIKRHLAQGQLAVVATPQDADAKPVTGQLSFVDNLVDTSTDTIKLKARFPNADHALWPGQFATVSLRLMTIPHATVVPAQAVQTGQDGQFVFVVKPDQTVEQRTVTTGESADPNVVISSGLQPGETIVIEGQLRLEPGTRVTRADPKTGEATPGGGRGRGGRGGRSQGGATNGPQSGTPAPPVPGRGR